MQRSTGKFLAAIVATGAALRLYRLGAQSLWHDEIASVFLAGNSLAESLDRVQLDVHPPLYFYALSLFRSIAGSSEFALRLPSALAGIVSIVIVFRVGQRLFGDRAGLLAAALFAVSTLEIYYAQEARSYAFMVLAGLLSMDALTGWLQTGTRRQAVYYVLATAALLYIHYFGFLLLLAQAVGLGLAVLASPKPRAKSLGRDRLSLAAAGLGGVTVALFYLPWLPVLAAQLGAAGDGFWIEPARASHPLRTLSIFASLERPPWGWLIDGAAVAVVFAVLLAGLLLVSRVRAGAWFPGRDPKPHLAPPFPVMPCALFTLAWLGVPIAAAFAASSLGFHAYTHRNLLVASPALFVALGALFRALPGRLAPALLVAAALAPSLALYPWYYGEPHKGDWRELTASLSSKALPADGFVFDAPAIRQNFDFYRGAAPYHFVDLRRAGVPPVARIWLVRDLGRNSDQLVPRRLEAWGYRRGDPTRFPGLEAWLYERPVTDPPGVDFPSRGTRE